MTSAPAPARQHARLLIIDFGSQDPQQLARRERESGVNCEVHPFDKAETILNDFNPKAGMLSGGPSSVTEAESPRIGTRVFQLGVPVLGICYGEQLMCDLLGGKVEGGHAGEFGRADIVIAKESPLFAGIGAVDHREPVWMSHGDRVTALPPGFVSIATSV